MLWVLFIHPEWIRYVTAFRSSLICNKDVSQWPTIFWVHCAKRTVQLGNRDHRGPRRLLPLEPAVSGSLAGSRSPEIPRNCVFFHGDGRCAVKVSASGDLMAVERVWGEPVSGCDSLILREKYREIFRYQTPRRILVRDSPAFPRR